MAKHGNDRPRRSKVWSTKKRALQEEVLALVARSPLLFVEAIEDLEEELRILLVFLIKTLVTPREGKVQTAGPVLVGLRYHKRFITSPPVPWEIVTVLMPGNFFHPNSSPGHGLCLGKPPAGVGLASVIHLTFAALTLSSFNTLEWQGMNPEAAAFVRNHADEFPLMKTGLFEEPEEPFHFPLGGNQPPGGSR